MVPERFKVDGFRFPPGMTTDTLGLCAAQSWATIKSVVMTVTFILACKLRTIKREQEPGPRKIT